MQLVIETKRTLTGALDASDAPMLRSYLVTNMEHLRDWEPTRDSSYFNLSNIEERILENNIAQEIGTALHLAAFSPDRTQILAICNFTNIVHGVFMACNLGYSISQRHEGNGIMYEVLSASICHVFGVLKLHRIMANYMPHNFKSARLLERLRFDKEGVAKSYLNISGHWQDHILTSKLAES